jgi:DNA-directed RNA polymerase II subunit RPB2
VAANHVFVFAHKAGQSAITHSAEVKSVLERTTRNSSKFQVYLQRVRGKSRNVSDRVIRCTVPYAKDTIPLFVLFRAMGFVADKEILQHIVYDFEDAEMLEVLRPSIEEAVSCTAEDVALDWIGRRIAQPFMVKAKRQQYAKDVLQKELLPHVGIGEMTETHKAYFVGYMVHRMLLVALGRQPQTDRDNYAVKRLRMAGPLMADLFRWAPLCCAHLLSCSAALLLCCAASPAVRRCHRGLVLVRPAVLMGMCVQGAVSQDDEGDECLREEAV